MFSAIKSLSIQTKPLFATSNNFAGKATPVIGTVRFQQASAGSEEPDNMEKNQQAKEHEKKGTIIRFVDSLESPNLNLHGYKRDVMSHSFGEGYATRSDEEGFGGIYGGNQSLSHKDEDKIVHGNCPEYDKTQGSEVKEKEKGRHQTETKS